MAKQIVEIVMPQLAESLVNATIDRWLKQPGDMIDMYEPICELITDKVNAELPSTVRGKLVKILAGAGEVVDVGAPICLVETEQEIAAPAPQEEAPAPAAAAPSRPAAAVAAPAAFDPSAPMRARYSPAVQRLAAENGVDLTRVAGTGIGGRITRKDVETAIQSGLTGQTQAAYTPAPATPAATPALPARPAEPPRLPVVEVDEGQAASGREYAIDVTPIRNTIAKNMRQSVNEIPHAWTMVEVDLTNLVQLRAKLKDDFKKNEGINLTFMPFLLKAVVGAIKEYPLMNSVWAVDKIIVKRDINLSLAVGTEDSVLTPVIRNADQKTITGLAHEINELARKTREGKLKLSDMQGGTFTVNNTGTFGSVLSYPIINYPQAAIMTLEAIVKRPVVIGDMIGIRSMVNLCLSFDHRILDGIICGRFHQKVKEILEGFGPDTKLY
ncbi:dihydrolipoamide acetyltransferase family protein [Cohnella candidum]|uniref:Dihydrolipoamide acetyltransferase component of pyruvate dehydrogenase complex n=1 Tax=Cohnella candidum TaxID=2674991 RepID=A0A3G3JX33_9BACL|nr:dihydrolipoamide acetyltransferase family protein [Cohnella candidum]AYQ72802.1 2-oxo acid dehydrogenase subunit E2 [Cohnella candidum]